MILLAGFFHLSILTSLNRSLPSGYRHIIETVAIHSSGNGLTPLNETVENGHGRIETRKCEAINNLDFLDEKEQWAGLSSLARITATREIYGKQTTEERLYISSVVSDAKSFNLFIRHHWGVENSLHWTLDVTFREDDQRKRNGHAVNNFALVEKIALNLLKSEGSKDISIKNKRLVAAWDNQFMLYNLRV
jgi:predicted transposase YbfD/YdcC